MDLPTYKVITLGSYGVGKTCLLLRATDDEAKFSEKYQCTIGVDFKTKVHDFQNNAYKFAIWDTAGQERFQHINKLYYKDCDAVLFVYDISNRKSFERIEPLLEDFIMNSEGTCAYVLIGNKADTENREVQTSEGRSTAKKLGMPLIECSAYTGENIGEIFNTLMGELQNKGLGKKLTESFVIQPKILHKKKKCC